MIRRFIRIFLFMLRSSILIATMFSISAKADSIKTLNFVSVNLVPFFGDDLLNQGYLAEVTREAFLREGYDVHYTFVPWKRAIKQAEVGFYDGLMGAYLTEDREKNFLYTIPIAENQTVLLSMQKSNIAFDNLQGLTPYKIGVIRGTSAGNIFDNATYLTKLSVDLTDQNINKLISGRIDMFVSGHLHIVKLLNQQIPNWHRLIKIHQPPLQNNLIYNIVSKNTDHPEKIVAAFNNGFRKIKEDGSYDRILIKHGLAHQTLN